MAEIKQKLSELPELIDVNASELLGPDDLIEVSVNGTGPGFSTGGYASTKVSFGELANSLKYVDEGIGYFTDATDGAASGLIRSDVSERADNKFLNSNGNFTELNNFGIDQATSGLVPVPDSSISSDDEKSTHFLNASGGFTQPLVDGSTIHYVGEKLEINNVPPDKFEQTPFAQWLLVSSLLTTPTDTKNLTFTKQIKYNNALINAGTDRGVTYIKATGDRYSPGDSTLPLTHYSSFKVNRAGLYFISIRGTVTKGSSMPLTSNQQFAIRLSTQGAFVACKIENDGGGNFMAGSGVAYLDPTTSNSFTFETLNYGATSNMPPTLLAGGYDCTISLFYIGEPIVVTP